MYALGSIGVSVGSGFCEGDLRLLSYLEGIICENDVLIFSLVALSPYLD
jgi:hypothetical protein